MFRRRRQQLNNNNINNTGGETTTPCQQQQQFTYYMVEIPSGVTPGQTFRVFCGSRLVSVVVPDDATPGKRLQIKVFNNNNNNNTSQTTTCGQRPNNTPHATLPPPVNPAGIQNNESSSYISVRVPNGVLPGQEFRTTINGQSMTVTCPARTAPGEFVRIVKPQNYATNQAPTAQSSTAQLYQVSIPDGVLPGQLMTVDIQGERVKVTVPPNCLPGQKIRFRVNITDKKLQAQHQLIFKNSNPWKRVLGDDGRLVWTLDGDSILSENDDEVASFVRILDIFPRKRESKVVCGALQFQPALNVTVDSCIKITSKRNLIDHADLLKIHRKSFKEKCAWFKGKCDELRVEWSKGHIELNVRRDLLLTDGFDAVQSLTTSDLRKVWKLSFIGEEGLDAGGVSREFFELLSRSILNPDNGLWLSSPNNPEEMEINPASEIFEENHLAWFRFFGRLIGKALFDGQLISGGRFSKYIIKHILGWPISLSDLNEVDSEYYNGLSQLLAMGKEGHDLSSLFLNFTITHEAAGSSSTVELIEGGADLNLTNDNLTKYLEESLKHRIFNRTKPQLTELLLGLTEVIPEPLLAVFDIDELSLLLCGSPRVDLNDWMKHTIYEGQYERHGPNHPVCRWFWEIVEDFDDQTRRRLLHFCTGSSGVPGRGFEFLQGSEGSIRKFTLTPTHIGVNPIAHTCFNRIDMPIYATKAELQKKLLESIENSKAGFTIE